MFFSGSVYYDFITIELEVKKLLSEPDEASVGYYMERLRPQVTNICSRINSLDTSTARNRLCQAEIAKKVAHLMRAVVSLQHGENNPSSSGKLTKNICPKSSFCQLIGQFNGQHVL